MYVSLSRLRVADELAAELVAAFRQRAHLVDNADGFVDLQVWQSDRDAFKAYMKSEQHRISHERIDPDLAAAIKLERLEHLHTYEVVAE